jgi:lipopolysaccharide transport system permease protein
MELKNPKQDWDFHIKSDQGWMDLNLKEVWKYKDLILLFVKRDWETIYKQTLLGPLWAILQPLFMTLIFSLVFNKIARIPTEGVPSILFYLAGLLPWNYFNNCFSKISTTLKVNVNLFGKVYFPRLTIPISNLISGLINFSITLCIFLAISFFSDYNNTATLFHILLLPFFFLLLALFSMGLGLIIASLTVKYRDLTFLVTFGIQLLMYGTPVIYPLSAVPDRFSGLIRLNPLCSVIEGFRNGLLGIGSIDSVLITYNSISILLIFIAGVVLFNKSEKSYIDIV